MAKTLGLTLTQVASDSKELGKLVSTTISNYTKLAVALHNTACAVFFHVAQGNDPKPLNDFYNGLRVNDRTALRVWFGQHASFVDLDSGTTRQWIRFTEKDGFSLVKGVEAHRKDLFLVEPSSDEADATKTVLTSLKPFYEKNIKDKDAITLEALIAMLGKAAERVTKQANDEGIKLPADVLTLTTSIKNTTAKELAAINAIKE